MEMYLYIIGLSVLMLIPWPKDLRVGKHVLYETDIKLWILFFSLLAVSGFRYHTGADFSTYENVFYMYQRGLDPFWLNYEPGFIYLNQLLAFLFDNAQVLFLISAFFMLLLVFWTYRKISSDALFSVFLFVTLYFFFNSFNYVRQYIAIAWTIFAYPDLKERKGVRYGIKILIASLFHTTALIMLFFYLISHKRGRMGGYAILTLGAAVLYICYEPLIEILVRIVPKYALYVNYISGGSKINLFILLCNFILLFSLDTKKVAETDRKAVDIYKNACFAAICFYVFSTYNTLFSRIGSYFFMYSTLSIPFCMRSLKMNRKGRMFIKACFCVGSILICLYYLKNNNAGIVPYTWYFAR